MDKFTFGAGFMFLFALLVIGSVMSVSVRPAAVALDGIDVVYGVLVMIFASALYHKYHENPKKNKQLMTAILGMLILVFVRVFEIGLQEVQAAGAIPWHLWTLSYLVTLVGAAILVKGVWEEYL